MGITIQQAINKNIQELFQKLCAVKLSSNVKVVSKLFYLFHWAKQTNIQKNIFTSSVSRGGFTQSMIRGGIMPTHLQENFYRCIKSNDSTRKKKVFSLRIDVDIKVTLLLMFHQELSKRGCQNYTLKKYRKPKN